ncbi:hypothetical protein KIPB_011047 [Kipferlia bialata]|uniref:Conserved oligomeric Golgi complex subunit 4 C-terminal domain-containing protein n=1 Tax=Kipferlia bialata TaxID=797122 RepID=A0A9K3D7G6_9EUKA|nr:hypothetical protein KIPB_011047 [Kipferlia bialata]|eukprot:g11047.t1
MPGIYLPITHPSAIESARASASSGLCQWVVGKVEPAILRLKGTEYSLYSPLTPTGPGHSQTHTHTPGQVAAAPLSYDALPSHLVPIAQSLETHVHPMLHTLGVDAYRALVTGVSTAIVNTLCSHLTRVFSFTSQGGMLFEADVRGFVAMLSEIAGGPVRGATRRLTAYAAVLSCETQADVAVVVSSGIDLTKHEIQALLRRRTDIRDTM